jgi:alanyl-tRNA synthetase
MLRILGAEKYKGMTRLGFITGRRCLFDSRRLRKNAELISRAISVPVGETGKGVLDFLEKTAALEEQLKTLKEGSNRIKAEALVEKACAAEAMIVEFHKAGIDEVLNIGKMTQKLLFKKDSKLFSKLPILILVSENENKFAAFCSQKEFDIRPLFRGKLEEFGGKGGGGPLFFQGSFGSGKDLAALIEEISGACLVG